MHLYVCSTAVHISQKTNKNEVFEHFYKINPDSKDSGIGLALMQTLVVLASSSRAAFAPERARRRLAREAARCAMRWASRQAAVDRKSVV